MTAQDTCLHHKHARQREHLDPVSESAVMPSKPIEPHSQQDSPGPNTKLNIEEILTDLEHTIPVARDGPGGTCQKRESTWATSTTGTCPPR